MLRLALLGGSSVELASGVDQPASGLGGDVVVGTSVGVGLGLQGVEQVTAFVALVSSGAVVIADGAGTLNEAVSEEGVVSLDGAEGLDSLALLNVAILPQLGEDVLDNFGLLGSGGSAEDIKGDVEVVVDALVNGVVLGAEGSRVDTLL